MVLQQILQQLPRMSLQHTTVLQLQPPKVLLRHTTVQQQPQHQRKMSLRRLPPPHLSLLCLRLAVSTLSPIRRPHWLLLVPVLVLVPVIRWTLLLLPPLILLHGR